MVQARYGIESVRYLRVGSVDEGKSSVDIASTSGGSSSKSSREGAAARGPRGAD